MRSVAAKTLHDRRRGAIGWSVGLALLVAIIAAYWPAVRDSPDIQDFARNLPDAIRALAGGGDYGTPAGYLSSELFAFMMPLLFLVVAIGMGARAIAGEEERGTIDVLLSAPITRRRVLLEKVTGGLVVLAGLGVVLFASLVVGSAAVDMGIPAGRLAAISAATVLLALPFGALALALSCATGVRGMAAGIASAAAVAAYLLDALAPLVSSLKGYRDLSPFAWYAGDEVLRGGLTAGHAALLAGVAAALVAVAAVALERRDLGT